MRIQSLNVSRNGFGGGRSFRRMGLPFPLGITKIGSHSRGSIEGNMYLDACERIGGTSLQFRSLYCRTFTSSSVTYSERKANSITNDHGMFEDVKANAKNNFERDHPGENIESLSKKILEQLSEKNYAVIDNILSQERFKMLSKEVEQCVSDSEDDWEKSSSEQGEVKTAITKHLKAKTLPYPIISQVIYFFTQDLPEKLNELLESSFRYSKQFNLESDLASHPDAILTLYLPGSVFSKHLDCKDVNEDGRRITLIYYLTENEWNSKKDGGQIRLYNEYEDNYLDIDPVPNRLVAYFSHLVPSEVLQPNRRRLSMCCWLSTMIEKGDEVENPSFTRKKKSKKTKSRTQKN